VLAEAGGMCDYLQMHRVLASVVLGFAALNGLHANAADERVTHDYYAVNGAKLYVESIGHGSPVVPARRLDVLRQRLFETA
jgi:hypothetical protein